MKQHKRYEPFLAIALLLALFGQAALGSVRLSLTTDEPMHTAMGYTDLVAGDYSLLPVHIHPPLVNEWAAWPLLLRPQRPDPHQVPGWSEKNLFKFSAQLLLQLGPVRAVELATRVPIMLLSLLLGALVYRWASDLAGPRAGQVALLLYVFDPGILSSSQFNTTDIGALAFGVLATFAAWRAARVSNSRRPGRRLIALSGLALGLSMASKVSGLFFAPMIAGLVGITRLGAAWGRRNAPGPARDGGLLAPGRRWGIRLALIYVLALGVVWAVYRFEFRPLPGGSWPVPAASHWLVLQAFNEHVAEGHMAFLAGQVGQYGWWWYFPLAFVLKTPIPTLFLLAVAIAGRLRRPWTGWVNDVWLGAIPLVYFVNAMFSTIDIGYRHLLPILPFAFVFIGVQVSACITRHPSSFTRSVRPSSFTRSVHPSSFIRHVLRFTLYALLVTWYVLGTLRLFPHYLAYFNELAGGAEGGYRYLADSNTDWGQAIKDLAAYQQAQGIERVRLSMFTFIDPAIYGVRYEPLTPMRGDTPAVFPARFNPPPGDYVISATTLQGIPLADPEMFDWFRKRQPDARIGHVMFVYRVRASSPRTWVAQCTTPAAPLEPDQVAEGFGQADLRLAYFDCGTSWLYPTGGRAPGWVVLPGDAPAQAGRWLAARQARLSYEQRRAGFSPPFRIYEDDGLGYSQGGRACVAPSDAALANALAAPWLDLPISFDGGLTLLGYRLEPPWVEPGGTAYLETTWRVESRPEQPLSLMAHVLGPDGRAVSVGDGLGVPVNSWQPGDVLVQRHALQVPGDTPPGLYWLQTGVYWLDAGKRWAVRDERALGDRVLLTELEVRDK